MNALHRRWTWCSLLLAAAGPVAMQGQLPEESLWRWSDSLELLTDTGIVRQLHDRAMAAVEAKPGDPVTEARAAILALRLLELNSDLRLVYPAARAFTALTIDHPD